jgi:hypothetical protein
LRFSERYTVGRTYDIGGKEIIAGSYTRDEEAWIDSVFDAGIRWAFSSNYYVENYEVVSNYTYKVIDIIDSRPLVFENLFHNESTYYSVISKEYFVYPRSKSDRLGKRTLNIVQ